MDSKQMKQIFQQIESMSGTKLGSYLRHGGRNTQQLSRIFEDDFTCAELEDLLTSLDAYLTDNAQSIGDMDPDFIDQHNQILAMRDSIHETIGDLNYKISNLPKLLEAVIQQQLQAVIKCYRENHTGDYKNMDESLKDLKAKGFQDTPENRVRFTQVYLNSYFHRVVANSIQSGSYKKYKVAVINRFQERYEEMLAG
jgi:hypothetical protein